MNIIQLTDDELFILRNALTTAHVRYLEIAESTQITATRKEAIALARSVEALRAKVIE